MVQTCTPQRYLTFTWTLGIRHGAATRVEVAFADALHGSHFSFTHTGWQTGQEADYARFADPGGWPLLLHAFTTAANGGLA